MLVSTKHAIAADGWSAIEKFGFGSLAPGKEGLPRYFTKFLRQYSLTKPSIVSDSFETLRAAAAAGSIVAVLPNRVAKRHNDLLELTPRRSLKSPNETGRHRILIVSQMNCDRAETDFVAEKARSLLGDPK